MSRVIRFRYWDPVVKHMFLSTEFSWPTQDQVLARFFDKASLYAEGSVMQWSGLTLPNGQDIYEGDILNTKVARWEVVFEQGIFLARVVWSGVFGTDYVVPLREIVDNAIPLGNRYEHPHLLVDNIPQALKDSSP